MAEPTESGAVEYAEQPAVPTIVIRATGHPLGEMAPLFDAAFGALFPALAERGIQTVGPAFSLHRRIPDDTADLEVGIAIDRRFSDTVPVGDFELVGSELPAGLVARTTYLGPYDGLGAAWGAFMQTVADSGRSPVLPFWELYVTEPTPESDPASLRTDLCTLVSTD